MQTDDLQIILRVAELQSISAAAISLDLTGATASAAVKRVESQLGSELFIRTTRQLRLSPAGERYIPLCEQALAMLDQAKSNIKQELDIIDGELRISTSSDLGRNLASDWLDEFMTLYPKIRLRTNISDSNVDFYRDSIDMALRYGSPQDSNLYGFKICNVPRLLCASPSYLKKYGTPKVPSDLVEHNALLYQLNDVINDVWVFNDNIQDHKVRLRGDRASNDADLVRRWCVSGHGVAVKSCLDMSNDLLSGNVVTIMPEFIPTQTELWLVVPSRQSITPAVRLLRDMFKEKSKQVLTRLVAEGILDKGVLH